MRRIIERVVTIVTTTTWKISWEPDSPHPDPATDSVSGELPIPKISPSASTHPTVSETKEADLWVEKPVTKQTTDDLPEDPHIYQLTKGNEKP